MLHTIRLYACSLRILRPVTSENGSVLRRMRVDTEKAAFEKDWLEVDSSIESMLPFASYPVYLSPIGEETILGEASGNALLPSPVLDISCQKKKVNQILTVTADRRRFIRYK